MSSDQIGTDSAKKLVSIYSYLTFAVVIYGLTAAHLPFIIGSPWTTCKHCISLTWCAIALHLYETPIVCFNAYIAWFGLKKFTEASLNSYTSLLTFAAAINIAFFTFESVLLLIQLNAGAMEWEIIALASIIIMLGFGSFLAIFVKQKLLKINNK